MNKNKSVSHVSEFGSSGSSPGRPHLRWPNPTVIISLAPRLLTVSTAAAYLGSTNWHVEELCRSGELPYLIVGKHRVIDIADLDAWVKKQRKQTGQLPAPKIVGQQEAA